MSFCNRIRIVKSWQEACFRAIRPYFPWALRWWKTASWAKGSHRRTMNQARSVMDVQLVATQALRLRERVECAVQYEVGIFAGPAWCAAETGRKQHFGPG